MTRSETRQNAIAAFQAWWKAVFLVFALAAVGSTAVLIAGTDEVRAQEADTEVVEDEAEAVEEEQAEGFTPPLFGAPERRVGAGSRDLGATPKPDCEPDAESGECPGDE